MLPTSLPHLLQDFWQADLINPKLSCPGEQLLGWSLFQRAQWIVWSTHSKILGLFIGYFGGRAFGTAALPLMSEQQILSSPDLSSNPHHWGGVSLAKSLK